MKTVKSCIQLVSKPKANRKHAGWWRRMSQSRKPSTSSRSDTSQLWLLYFPGNYVELDEYETQNCQKDFVRLIFVCSEMPTTPSFPYYSGRQDSISQLAWYRPHPKSPYRLPSVGSKGAHCKDYNIIYLINKRFFIYLQYDISKQCHIWTIH